jgi:carboxymethylenebutenolidase
MGRKLSLTAADGHRLGAYRADPVGTPRGRVVVIQEIFGVNRHIRSVCDRLAEAGYVALAPQVFDRISPNFETGYSEMEVAKAREFIAKVDWAKLMEDTKAAFDSLKREGPVAILGFCMGGSVAYLASARIDGLAAAVCYYGGQIIRYIDEKPRCPVQMHFGETDGHIPLSDVETMRKKQPEAEIHVYAGAGHGFHCDERGSFEPKSAKQAWDRSLAFLSRSFAAASPIGAMLAGGAPRPAPAPMPAQSPIAKQSGAPAPAAAGASRQAPVKAKKTAKPKKKAKAKTKKSAKKKSAKKSAKKSKKKAKKKSKRR